MKLFLSGVEKIPNLEIICKYGHKYVLMSYLYLRKHPDKMFPYIKDHNLELFLDSGVHTILEKGSVEAATGQNLQEYLTDYLEFIYEYKDHINIACELDIQDLVDAKTMIDIRKEFLKIDFVDVPFVIHAKDIEENGYSVINKYFDDFPFVAISKFHSISGPMEKSVANAVIKGKKLHGLAITGREIRRFPFYSVDSTTWLGGARYGTTYVFTGQTLETWTYDSKYRRKKFKEFCQRWEIDWGAFIKDNRDEVNKFNAVNWILYGKFLEKRWNNAGR